MDTEMKKRALKWEMAGIAIIFFVGAVLHFVFEWAHCWPPLAAIAPVNESVWEHFKLGFWPGLLYGAIEYVLIGRSIRGFWVGKAWGLFIMPLIVGVGFYAYTAVLGDDLLVIDISLFLVAVAVGQWVSYRVMVREPIAQWARTCALIGLVAMAAAFSAFSYLPPRVPLFVDSRTQQVGIPEDCGMHSEEH
jgi:hypothetical protein